MNWVSGSRFDDTFTAIGVRGDLFFMGNAGNDVIIGSAEGINNFDSNSVVYGSSRTGINVRLGAHSKVTGDASTGTDKLTNVETIIGSFYDDVFVADTAFVGAFGRYNMFQGRQGDDTIRGNGFTTMSFYDDYAAVKVDLANGTAFAIDPADAAAVGIDTILGGVNGVFGSRYDDIIIGGNSGRAELLRGGEGNGRIDGGGGTMNVIEYRSRFSDVIVDLAADTARDGRGGTDTLANIQGVRGSEERDIITGDAAANQLVGEEATTICLALAATTSWSATTISTRGPERSAPIRSSTPATICWMAARATTG